VSGYPKGDMTANCPVMDCDGSVKIHWIYYPAEKRTHFYPGCPSEMEVEVMAVCTECGQDEFTPDEHQRLTGWVEDELDGMEPPDASDCDEQDAA